MRKKVLVVLTYCLVGLFAAVPIYAASSVPITIEESSGNSYSLIGTIASIDNAYLASYDFISSTGLDVALGGHPFMLANDLAIVAVPITAYDSNVVFYTTGNTPASAFRILTGYDGYITIPDDDTIELGNDFELEIKGYIDTSSGSDKNLVYKASAFQVYVSDDEEITAKMLVGGIEGVATGVATGLHTVKVTADTTDFKLFIDGAEEDSMALSGNSVPTNGLDWQLAQNEVMPYIEYFKIACIEDIVVTEEVASSYDDAHEFGTGTFSTSNSYLNIYSNTDSGSSSYRCAGTRFTSVDIPQGAVIVACETRIRTGSSDLDANCKIYWNDVDDAVDFNTDADIIGRVRTSGSTSWVQDGLAAQQYVTKSLIIGDLQDVIDRIGWEANNDLVLLWIANTDATKYLATFAYDSETGQYPQLWVTYESLTPNQALWFEPNAMIDNTSFEGTADSGTTTTLVDAALSQADDYWNLARLVITETTDHNAPEGENAVVTNYVQSSNTLEFAALTAAPESGDTYTVEFGTLVDRTGDNDARITWGVNPTGVTTTVGTFLPEVDISAVTIDTDVPDLMPEYNPNVSSGVEGEDFLFYALFKGLMDDYYQSGGPEITMPYFWKVLATAIALALGTAVLVMTKNIIIGIGAYALFIALPTAMGILDWYYVVWYVIGAVAVALLVTKWTSSSI